MTEASRRIRVLIVEDSVVVRILLERIIESDPRLTVAASVESGEEALRVVDDVAPDVISMDIRLPGMNGMETTRAIMARRPTPIVVVSASVEAEDLRISMNALRAGALSVVEKPGGPQSEGFEAIAARICSQLVLMSDVKVIRQRGAVGPAPWHRPSDPVVDRAACFAPDPRLRRFDRLGIVASTGGPNALARVFDGLGADFCLPIMLVQHITPSFLEGFASWIADISGRETRVVRDSEPLRPRVVYLGPPDGHLEVRGDRACVAAGEKVSGQRPSGTVLFHSMACSAPRSTIGVLLTGMGEDGAEGLLALRRSGGHTIAEDASTAVVYGMPMVAARIGAAAEQLPLHLIAARLKELTSPLRIAP